MNAPTPPIVRRRRPWLWVLLAAVLTPLIVLGAATYSYIHLDRDADVLRQQVMRGHQSDWQTTIEVSLGSATVTSLRSCLHLVRTEEMAQIRQALAAVRGASVGVYELRAGQTPTSGRFSTSDTDAAMRDRGWTRVVGVIDGGETVLIYIPADTDEPEQVCLAVLDGRELVVVSATINPDALVELIEAHCGAELRGALSHIQ